MSVVVVARAVASCSSWVRICDAELCSSTGRNDIEMETLGILVVSSEFREKLGVIWINNISDANEK